MEKDNRAIRYRVYPTEKQQDILQQTFGCARLVFNETLLMHRGLYEAGMKTFSQMDMNNYCNRFMKENMPFLRNVDKFALTNSIYNAFAAFKNFFKGRNRYPRRKSRKDASQSYTTNCTNNNIAIIRTRRKVPLSNYRNWEMFLPYCIDFRKTIGSLKMQQSQKNRETATMSRYCLSSRERFLRIRLCPLQRIPLD